MSEMPGESTLLAVVVVIQVAQFIGGTALGAYLVARQLAVERELHVSSHPAIVARTLTDHGRRIEHLESRMEMTEADARLAKKHGEEAREALFVLRGQADIMSRLLVAICNHLGIPIPRGVDLSGITMQKGT